MSNATIAAIFSSIPMALLVIAQIGILRSRLVFAIVGVIVIILTSLFLLAGSFASQMASGSGGGGSGGWEGWWPLPLLLGIEFGLLIVGIVGRPHVTEYDRIPEAPEPKRFPTLRQVEAERKSAEQAAASDRDKPPV